MIHSAFREGVGGYRLLHFKLQRMKTACWQLYANMLREIEWCSHKIYSNREYVERCFQVSCNAFGHLQKIGEGHFFADQRDEIWFFKTLKPQFAAQMEYFILLYTTELFAPDEIPLKSDYWIREFEKTFHFLSVHKAFYLDYKQEGSECDTLGFSRSDPRWQLAARIIAREKYLKYLQKKIAQPMIFPAS